MKVPSLERILAALVERSPKRELRIPLPRIRKLSDESFRLSLDMDDTRDEVVLRFDPKHSAIFVVEPEWQPAPQPAPGQPKMAAPAAAPTPVRAPLSDAQLAQRERVLRRQGVVATLRREQAAARQQTPPPVPGFEP